MCAIMPGFLNTDTENVTQPSCLQGKHFYLINEPSPQSIIVYILIVQYTEKMLVDISERFHIFFRVNFKEKLILLKLTHIINSKVVMVF